MAPYIYGSRGGVHIIDLTKTDGRLQAALKFIHQTTAAGGKVLFVGTKRQARSIVREEAIAAGQPFVTERWLGGLLTNFRTIRTQVARLRKLEAGLSSGDFAAKYNKKEVADLTEEAAALERIFGGIKELDGLPAALFVVDVPAELIAVREARRLGLPVVAITDTNADPDLVDYVIPANDDAIKAIRLITHAAAAEAAAGASESAAKAGEREAAAATAA